MFCVSLPFDLSKPVRATPPAGFWKGWAIWIEGYVRRGARGLDLPAQVEALGSWVEQCVHAQGRERLPCGQYAAVAVDLASRTVTSMVDELAIGSLFAARTDTTLLLSSSAGELRDHLGLVADDDRYLTQFLLDRHFCELRTPFTLIDRLDGVRHGTPSLHGALRRMRTPMLQERTEWRALSREAATEVLSTLLDTAVRGAMPPGDGALVELSGGLDSSTVCSIAARAAPLSVQAVTVAYPGMNSADETEWARRVVDRSSIPWLIIDGTRQGQFAGLPDGRPGEPCTRMTVASADQELRRLAQHTGCAVVFAGAGGDEVLHGDEQLPLHVADALLDMHPITAWRHLLDWTRRHRPRHSFGFWAARGVAAPLLRYILGKPMSIRAATVSAQLLRDAALLSAAKCREVRNYVHHPQYRYPLLDRDLVEFAMSVPFHYHVSATSDRKLHRAAIRGLVPQRVRLRRSKGGTDEPLHRNFRRPNAWRGLLGEDALIVQRGLVDGADLARTCQLFAHGASEGFRGVLAALALEWWLRNCSTPDAALARPLSLL